MLDLNLSASTSLCNTPVKSEINLREFVEFMEFKWN